MTPEDLESIFETLARALDAAGEEQHAALLAKLVLLLSRDLDDPGLVCRRIMEAGKNLAA
ncbi:hypothetical protein [Leisingera caerulea]|uniref:hypothetical protein n=1 Tax=Leisingera caerulea TaxID=506591 RepID=UPI0021A7456C|nr:hypothetical protein [Leisingera caerulea]UWQ85925.1 hypothetical protein K3726_20835 [Leisingera caerulea]